MVQEKVETMYRVKKFKTEKGETSSVSTKSQDRLSRSSMSGTSTDRKQVKNMTKSEYYRTKEHMNQ